jgi:error-prone DNA polymerase
MFRRAALWNIEDALAQEDDLFSHAEAAAARSGIRENFAAPDASAPGSGIRENFAVPESNAAPEERKSHDFRYETEETPLAPMTLPERLNADFAHLGITTGEHPMAILRAQLPDVTRASELKQVPDGSRVTIAGSVICRQRPGTASGVVFVSLEDETGIANAVLWPDFFEKHRLTVTQEAALRITGPLQNVAGVIHVQAQHVEALRCAEIPAQASHDFH